MPWSIASDPANNGRFTVDAEVDFALKARQRTVAEYEAAYDAADYAAHVFTVVPPPPVTE